MASAPCTVLPSSSRRNNAAKLHLALVEAAQVTLEHLAKNGPAKATHADVAKLVELALKKVYGTQPTPKTIDIQAAQLAE